MPVDTPPEQHPTPKPGESVLEYRVGVLEQSVAGLHRKADKLLEKMSEKDADHKVAIERCSSHGVRLDTIETERLPECHRRIDSIQGSSGAIAASRQAPPEAPAAVPAQARTIWDVLWHPATPMAFCCLLLLAALYAVLAFKSGRPASDFTPPIHGVTAAPGEKT